VGQVRSGATGKNIEDGSRVTWFAPWRYAQPTHAEFGSLTEENGRLVCHVCGRAYAFLAVHVRRTHMSVDDYKEMFGLNRDTGLVAGAVRTRMVESAAQRYAAGEFRNDGSIPAWPKGKRRTYRLQRVLAQADRNRLMGIAKRKPPEPKKVRMSCKRGHPWPESVIELKASRRCGVCYREWLDRDNRERRARPR
jgi:hypothetical protein